MSTRPNTGSFDGMEDLDTQVELPPVRNMPQQKVHQAFKKAGSQKKGGIQRSNDEITKQAESRASFDFSYQASRHERGWLVNSLGNFYEGHWIDDVLRLVKGGKEASVYLCTASHVYHPGQPFLAAKVYRPRMLRNLRKDHLYREGRSNLDIEGHVILDERMQRAMSKRSDYGLELLHSSWIGHEFKTMQILYEAGVDLPRPYSSGVNAILMDYIGAPDLPAPTLNTFNLDLDEARLLFERMIQNIDRMLSCQRIHGDLSAYNVLYWDGKLSLIDFPQAIDPLENRNAFRIFDRDVHRICEYFTRQGLVSNPGQLVRELWSAHGYRFQPEVHPQLLDDQDEQDRRYWQSLQES
jgi:RIO kinase 1